VRAKVEHPFLIITRIFGFVKTRYKGLANARCQTIFGYLFRGSLDLLSAPDMKVTTSAGRNALAAKLHIPQ
jgi:hypothetical protein